LTGLVLLSTQVRGAGRPIVLLPWFSLDQAVMAAAFEPVFAATAGWRRVYMDLPGTGSSPPVEPRSDAVLDAVLSTIESALGSERFLLAGCSYGGYLAAGITRRVPDQVAGLLLVCAGVKIRRAERNLGGVLASAPEPGWLRDIPEELHEHFSHAIGAQTSAVAIRVADAFSLNGPIHDDYLTVLQSDGYQLSDEKSPHSFDGSVTILTGRRDRIAGYLDQFDTLARYCHGNFVALGDAGHYLPFEEPDCFESVTLDWLAQAERPPA
jgi:pimeloyl-ACP methyl ester carboxylesterase